MTSMWIPAGASKKHEELSARPVGVRGDDAKAKYFELHSAAEERAVQALQAKMAAAADHNLKAGFVAAGSKMADRLVFAERKVNADFDMALHTARRNHQVKKVANKGEKVGMTSLLARSSAWSNRLVQSSLWGVLGRTAVRYQGSQ